MRADTVIRTGGQILVDQLVAQGCDHVFCVPGESYLAVLDALHDAKSAVTICRQEGGAAMMAEAYGKLTGRPGICMVTRGPGATNASPGLHIAQQDSSPMILFVGQIERGMRGRDAFQEVDYTQLFGGMCKWVAEIDDCARIPEMVARAYATAMQGRPGPVVLVLPEDMLTESADVPDAPYVEAAETWPGLTDMAKLQKLLWAAKQPVLILGGSRWSEKAVSSVTRFAERFDLPVICQFRRQMLFDHSHPNYAGDLGLGGNPDMLKLIKEADLVIALGGRLSEIASQSYTLLDIPKPQMTFVHVHPGAEEIGRVYQADLAIDGESDRLLRLARGPAAAAVHRLGRPRRRRPRELSRLDRQSGASAGRVPVWRGHGLAARPPAGRRRSSATAPATTPAWVHRFLRFRNHGFDAARPDLGLHGLRRAGGGRCQAHVP